MNPENSKTSKLHVLILKLNNKLKEVKKGIALSNLSILYTGKHKNLIQQ